MKISISIPHSLTSRYVTSIKIFLLRAGDAAVLECVAFVERRRVEFRVQALDMCVVLGSRWFVQRVM